MRGFILIGKIKDICQVLRVLTEFEREMTNLLARRVRNQTLKKKGGEK